MSDHAAPLQSFTPVLRAVRIGVDCSSQQHTEWLAQLLPLLSVFDATRVRSKRRVVDALRSAIAALMLRAAAAPYGVIRNSTGRPQAVVVDSSGAHVPCPYRDVSASHHGDWVVVGGVNTRGACIGVDIVRVSEIAGCAASNHYLRSKFLDDEWDMLSRDPTARLLAAFWSAKEAHAKVCTVRAFFYARAGGTIHWRRFYHGFFPRVINYVPHAPRRLASRFPNRLSMLHARGSIPTATTAMALCHRHRLHGVLVHLMHPDLCE